MRRKPNAASAGLPGFDAAEGVVELIYFSPSKLSAFISAPRTRRGIAARNFDFKVSALGFMAELSADLEPRPEGMYAAPAIPIRQLTDAVNYIRRIAKLATDKSVRAEDWIFFDGAFIYDDWSSREYRLQGALFIEDRGRASLALHGSAYNLVPRERRLTESGRLPFTGWSGLEKFVVESLNLPNEDNQVTISRLAQALDQYLVRLSIVAPRRRCAGTRE